MIYVIYVKIGNKWSTYAHFSDKKNAEDYIKMLKKQFLGIEVKMKIEPLSKNLGEIKK